MRYRKLTQDGDYTFGTGSDFYVNDAQAVAQSISTRLKLWQGEWFLDIREGTPWLTQVLGKYTQEVYDIAIRSRILETPGVVSIEDYESALDRRTRKLSVSAKVTTIYGTTSVLSEFITPPPSNQTILTTEDGAWITTESGQPLTL